MVEMATGTLFKILRDMYICRDGKHKAAKCIETR